MRRGLFELNIFVNVHRNESLNEGVAEETTRLERSADLKEAWHADAILFRRFHKIPLDQEGAHVFTRFHWAVMMDDENAFRFRRQKKIMGKMLAKVLIPLIYNVRARWPITMEDFEACLRLSLSRSGGDGSGSARRPFLKSMSTTVNCRDPRALSFRGVSSFICQAARCFRLHCL